MNQALEPVSITTLEPNRIGVEADLATPGLLILSEVNYPGWTAIVNGVQRPIVEVNGLLRGVVLPGGAAHVDMVFQPQSLTWGIALSIAGLIIWLALIVSSRRRRVVD